MLVDLTIRKIDRWAIKELEALRQGPGFPIYVPISDKSWLIGSFQIDELGPQQWKLTRDGKLVHVFYSKQAAVFYAVFDKFHMYEESRNLLELDKQVARSSDELGFYTAKLAKKRKKSDDFKQQLWNVRFEEAKTRFKYSKEDLTKRLNSTKYITVWERIL